MRPITARLTTVLVASCLLSHPLLSTAQGEDSILDLPLEQLQNIVVTESKVAQAADTVTQRIEVVDAAEIERQPTLNRNLSELLTYRSGLFVNTLSRDDPNWGSFGGLGPKYNGYLLDGLPIDSFLDSMSLDPWAFERVELYKGPASVMYSNYLSMNYAGNESPLTGITNFVLKDSVDQQLTRLQLGGGSFGTAGGKVYHQGSRGGLSYFVGGNYESAGYTNYGTETSWLNFIDDPDYQQGAVYAKMAYRLGEGHSLSLFAHHFTHTGDKGRPHRDEEFNYDTVNLAYSNQLTEVVNLQLKGGYRNYETSKGNDKYDPPKTYDLSLNNHSGLEQRIFPLDLNLNLKHFANSLLTIGADTQLADYQTTTEAAAGGTTTNQEVSAWSRGLYLQEKLVLDRWVLRAGGRFNESRQTYETINSAAPTGERQTTWSQPLWSAGLRFNASEALAFYGNLGTSFVAPTVQQTWGTIPAGSAEKGQLPNSGLLEESGLGSDLGVEWHPAERLTVGLRGFLNQVDEAIIQNVVSPVQSQFINAGQASSYGAEAMLDHKLNDDLHWFANLTYTASEVTNPNTPDEDGTAIPFVPDWLANVGLTASLPYEITLSPYLHWVGSYYDATSRSGRHDFGATGTVNLRAERPFWRGGKGTVKGFLELTNLTNERFEMPWGFQDPGFGVFIGAEAAIF